MNCTYLINMDDGRLELRDQYTEQQVNLKPIPDEVKEMILRREVTPKDVINAISIKMKESGDFNITEYLEGLKKLNVSQAHKQAMPERVELSEVTDAVSVSEVKAAKDNNAEAAKSTKRERSKKVNDIFDKVSDGNPLAGI